MIPKPLAVAIVCVVTLVWVSAMAMSLLVEARPVDGWVHTIFLTIVGGALGLSRKGGPPDSGTPAVTGEQPEPTPPELPPADEPRRGGAHRALLVPPTLRSVIA